MGAPIILVLVVLLLFAEQKPAQARPPSYPPGTYPGYPGYPPNNAVGQAANALAPLIGAIAAAKGGLGYAGPGTPSSSVLPGSSPPGSYSYTPYAPGASAPGPWAPQQQQTTVGDGLVAPNFDAATTSDVSTTTSAGDYSIEA